MVKHIVCFVACTTIVALNGCSNNNPTSTNSQEDYALIASTENQSGENIARDVADIATAFNFTKTGILSKQATGDVQWQSWTYTNAWWIRSGSISYTTSEGAFSLSGIDSVTFVDSNGNSVQNPLLSAIHGGGIRHHATIYLEKTGGGFIEASRDWNLTGSIDTDVETLTLSGTYHQKFNAENGDKSSYCEVEGTATVSDVVFEKELTGWSKPISGVITVTSPYTTIVVTFSDASAHITVTGADATLLSEDTISL